MKRIVFSDGGVKWGWPAGIVAAVIIAITEASIGGVYLIAFVVGMIGMLIAEPPDWLRRRWLDATGRNSRR